MYWILASERSDEYEFSIDTVPSIIEQLDLDFGEALPITKDIPLIDIPYSIQPDERKTDNVCAPGCFGLLINKNVKFLFDSLSISTIQYFPTRLVNIHSKETETEYFLSNITATYACVDKEKSELEFYKDGTIEFINRLVLNPKLIPKDQHIFRLTEFLPVILISNELKNKIAKAGVTGFKMYQPEDFDL